MVIPDGESRGQAMMAGDRLDDLTLSDADGLIFRGRAAVRRIGERDGALVLGVEFEGSGLDLAEVYRRGTRRSFAERWKAHSARSDHHRISADFKAWILDLRIDLERFRDFLGIEEAALDHADEVTRKESEGQYLAEIAPQLVERVNRAAAELGRFWSATCRRTSSRPGAPSARPSWATCSASRPS